MVTQHIFKLRSGTSCSIVLMPSNLKKHKLSLGLSGPELQVVYNSMVALKNIIAQAEEEAGPNEPPPESFEYKVDRMLSLLESKLADPDV